MSYLPQEIYQEILSNLSGEDLLNVCQSSGQFNFYCLDPTTWRNIYMREYGWFHIPPIQDNWKRTYVYSLYSIALNSIDFYKIYHDILLSVPKEKIEFDDGIQIPSVFRSNLNPHEYIIRIYVPLIYKDSIIRNVFHKYRNKKILFGSRQGKYQIELHGTVIDDTFELIDREKIIFGAT